jgi:hypothetical protein
MTRDERSRTLFIVGVVVLTAAFALGLKLLS